MVFFIDFSLLVPLYPVVGREESTTRERESFRWAPLFFENVKQTLSYSQISHNVTVLRSKTDKHREER